MRATAATVEAVGAPMRIEELEIDEPRAGEALVRVNDAMAASASGEVLKPVLRMPA